MATAAQIAANRANAQLSTGPKTEEGKARSSQNNFRSGLTSREFVVLPGQEDLFKEWIINLHQEIQPCGALEFDVFRQLAHASWTLHRCRQAEVQSFNNQCHKGYDILAYPVSEDALKFIDLYTRRAERSYQRALKELKSLQTERLLRGAAHPAPAPLADPRIVTQQKQSASGEKTITAGANQSSAAEPPASPSTDSEKSNPIECGEETAVLKITAMPRNAGPTLNDSEPASESGDSEKSNPIASGHGGGALPVPAKTLSTSSSSGQLTRMFHHA